MIIHLLAGCEPISRRGWKAASCCFSRNYPGTLKIRTWKILNSSLNTAISPRLKLLCLCCWMVVYGRRWLPWRSSWSSGTPSPPKVQVIHTSNVILLWLHMSLWDDWSLKHTFSWKKTFLLKQRQSSKRHSLIMYRKQIGNWLVTSYMGMSKDIAGVTDNNVNISTKERYYILFTKHMVCQ